MDGIRCVDIFYRPNGTFGFEEFRRDVYKRQGLALDDEDVA